MKCQTTKGGRQRKQLENFKFLQNLQHINIYLSPDPVSSEDLKLQQMRPPLFVLLLNLPTLPLAASEVSAQAEHAMVRYRNHLEEFSKTGSLDNYKMACLELRMASTRLNNKLQANSSSHRSFLVKDKIMNTLAGGCKPYGL